MPEYHRDDWGRVSQINSLGLVGVLAALIDHGAWVWPASLLIWVVFVAFKNTTRRVRYVPAAIATATLWSALILAVASTSLLLNSIAFYAMAAVILLSLVVILVDRWSSYKDLLSEPKGDQARPAS